ncbi:hypothetical protein ACVIKO_004301 [Rhizobium ruizarguesonis]
MIRANPTLATILTRRIAFFAMLAMLVQLAVIFSDYYWNVGELSRLFVEQETGRLASGVGDANGGVTYRLPEEIEQRYSNAKTGYIARIRDASGTVIFESCDDACESRFSSEGRQSTRLLAANAHSGEAAHIGRRAGVFCRPPAHCR